MDQGSVQVAICIGPVSPIDAPRTARRRKTLHLRFLAGHDVLVPDDHIEDVEAVRLNLAQIAAAPDGWRARAISAGGFLGAAAAVTLWSLAQQGSRVGGAASWVASGAALAYLVAVVIFLIASILPPPKFDTTKITGAANQLHASATAEATRVKRMVFLGAGLGGLAIVLTSVSIFLLLMNPRVERASVSFTDEAERTVAETFCPGLPVVFRATITDDGSEMLRISVLDGGCPEDHADLIVPRIAILQAQPE